MALELIRLTASTATVHQDLTGIVVKRVRATERSSQQNYSLFLLLQWYPVDKATITYGPEEDCQINEVESSLIACVYQVR